MSLADLSFKLYADAALTNLVASPVQFTHQSDLSDNPQDVRYWFGSPLSDRVLRANSNPGVANIILTPTDILPVWQASTAYTLGQTREPTPNNDRRYVVQTAGISGATQPTWPTAIGSTVADGSVLWRCVAKTHEPSEIKLAATQAGLPAATGGAGFSLGTQVLGGVANAREVWVRVTNTVQQVSSNAVQPELALNINEVIETAV
jgi:hypothetical protein